MLTRLLPRTALGIGEKTACYRRAESNDINPTVPESGDVIDSGAAPNRARRAVGNAVMAVHEELISRWSEYVDLVESSRFRSWAFRGHREAAWQLWSSLSRYLRLSRVSPRVWAFQESRILRIFRRKAHLFLDKVPSDGDVLQWLALMQHHGAPTRIIDLTWSPYVAAFFALEHAEDDAAVWALYPQRVNMHPFGPVGQSLSPDLWNRESAMDNYEKTYVPNLFSFVLVGDPFVMNQRLIAQSGTFAVPGTLKQPVDEILADYPDSKQTIVKLRLKTQAVRRDAMRSLYAMNITNATLFPGLDGLGRSMAYEFEYHWALDPYTCEVYPEHEWVRDKLEPDTA